MGLGAWAAQAAWRAIYSTSPTSRHPSAASNEERSGAPGGHLAGRRLLGSRAEALPAPRNPSLICLSVSHLEQRSRKPAPFLHV